MKKVFLPIMVLSAGFVSPVFASNDTPFTPFTTLAQAEQYCPAINALTFTPINPTPNSSGNISGTHGVNFMTPVPVSHPKNINTEGVITDAEFYFDPMSKFYGFITEHGVINCLYKYTIFSGSTGHAVLRSK